MIFKIILHKAPFRIGIPGNELADSLAKYGINSYGSLGRFSPPRNLPLSPPQLGYNSDIWNAKTPQEQSEFLHELLLNYRHLIPSLPISAKKRWISEIILSLISIFQSIMDPPELKAIRKCIKISASKDKKYFIAAPPSSRTFTHPLYSNDELQDKFVNPLFRIRIISLIYMESYPPNTNLPLFSLNVSPRKYGIFLRNNPLYLLLLRQS